MEAPNKDNTLYLPIRQVYFDQIIAGTKVEEFREIKEGITANRYLIKAPAGSKSKYVVDEQAADPSKEWWIDDYNGGKFPFKPRPYLYLSLAVGYAKERDTALVRVDGYRFIPGLIRAEKFAFWQIAYHIAEVIELHRKPRP